jgi:phosphopantetheinyl transferase
VRFVDCVCRTLRTALLEPLPRSFIPDPAHAVDSPIRIPSLHIPEDVHYGSFVFSRESTRNWMQILTEEELDRREGMRNEQRRRSFTAGRIALRTMLAEHLGLAPVDVPLIIESSGRLACQGSDLHLSLAHSGDVAVAAFSTRNVGIDLEQIRPKPATLLDYILADEERDHVHNLDLDADRTLFLCWTVKEAVLKANGTGLRRSPRLVRTSIDTASSHAEVRDPSDETWDVHFGLTDQFAAALAVERPA